jgi:hypothetical protein
MKKADACRRARHQGRLERPADGRAGRQIAKARFARPPQPETISISAGDPHVADLEAKLREVFATKVQLNYAQGKGSVEISPFQRRGIGADLQILGVRAD